MWSIRIGGPGREWASDVARKEVNDRLEKGAGNDRQLGTLGITLEDQ